MKKDVENKCSTCTACMCSGMNIKYQLPSTEKNGLPALTEPGQQIQIDLSGKLHNKHVTGKPYILIGIDRYSKWPVVRKCTSTEAKVVIKFLESFINFYDVPEKIKSDRGNAFISRDYEMFCRNRNFKIKYSPPRLHTGTGAVERAIQTLTKLIIVNLDDKIGLTENKNRALRVMRFTIHTGL